MGYDLVEEADVDRMFTEIETQLGPVDILVVNATPDQPLKPIEEYDWEFYQQMLDFFVKSPYLLTRRALASMKEKGWGRIINIASVVGIRGNAGQANYSASKAGDIGFTRALAQEGARNGITVNVVAPGYIATDMVMAVPEKVRESIIAQIPVGRLGEADEIARCVAFLASDEAGFITGAALPVDGGTSVRVG